MPIFLGYLPVGLAFGIVARTAGFTVPQAVVCSAIALAGAGQFVGVSLVTAGADLVSILITNAIINLRYLLFATGRSTRKHANLVADARASMLIDDRGCTSFVDPTERGSPSVKASACWWQLPQLCVWLPESFVS